MWLLVALASLVFLTQELVLRLGAVTGAGHTRLIFERFGRRGAFALGGLLVVNALTAVADFGAIAYALALLGAGHWLAAPLGAAVLLGVVVRAASAPGSAGCSRCWRRRSRSFRCSCSCTTELTRRLRCATAGRPTRCCSSSRSCARRSRSGSSSSSRRSRRQADHAALATVRAHRHRDGHVRALLVAVGVLLAFARTASRVAGTIFAVLPLDAALLGTSAVAVASAYSVAEVVGRRHSLHRGVRGASAFHAVYAGFVVLGALAVLVPGISLGGARASPPLLLPVRSGCRCFSATTRTPSGRG